MILGRAILGTLKAVLGSRFGFSISTLPSIISASGSYQPAMEAAGSWESTLEFAGSWEPTLEFAGSEEILS